MKVPEKFRYFHLVINHEKIELFADNLKSPGVSSCRYMSKDDLVYYPLEV